MVSSTKAVMDLGSMPREEDFEKIKLTLSYDEFKVAMDGIHEGETGRLLLVYANLLPYIKLSDKKKQLRNFPQKYVWGFFKGWDGILIKEFSTEEKAKNFVKKLEGASIHKAVDDKKVYLWYCSLKKLESEEGRGFVILSYVKREKEKEVKELLKDLKEGIDYKIVERVKKGVLEEIKEKLAQLEKNKEANLKEMIALKKRLRDYKNLKEQKLLLFRLMEKNELKELIK